MEIGRSIRTHEVKPDQASLLQNPRYREGGIHYDHETTTRSY